MNRQCAQAHPSCALHKPPQLRQKLSPPPGETSSERLDLFAPICTFRDHPHTMIRLPGNVEQSFSFVVLVTKFASKWRPRHLPLRCEAKCQMIPNSWVLRDDITTPVEHRALLRLDVQVKRAAKLAIDVNILESLGPALLLNESFLDLAQSAEARTLARRQRQSGDSFTETTGKS